MDQVIITQNKKNDFELIIFGRGGYISRRTTLRSFLISLIILKIYNQINEFIFVLSGLASIGPAIKISANVTFW